MKKSKLNRIQILIIVFIWLLLFAVPVLFGQFNNEIKWEHIFSIWRGYFFLFILFAFNRFVLFPLLFLKQKQVIYFLTISTLVVLLAFISFYSFKNKEEHSQLRPVPELRKGNRMERPPIHPPSRPLHRVEKRREFIPPYANQLILSILIIGFDIGLMLSMKWIESQQKQISLEKENVENKLAFLSQQISPHFFMNTLNNIHALIDKDTEQAQDSVIKLSNLMRYMLYESGVERIDLSKELKFISDYIELMKIRFSKRVKVNLSLPKDINNAKVPPLLFISLIENAFKHGISYKEESFIDIGVDLLDEGIRLNVENSKFPKEKNENSGIGINNTIKRLKLIYGSNYKFDILEDDKIFSINLIIPYD